MVDLPTWLDEAKIANLPASAYYIPNFITEDEEVAILNKIATAPKPRWKQLTHRRLQAWPSELVQDRLLDSPLPPWLQEPIIPRIKSMSMSDDDPSHLFDESPHSRPNHVLINEYPPGVGIMPHKVGLDGW
jgi:alkylated DNA repair protein alkB family protein 6